METKQPRGDRGQTDGEAKQVEPYLPGDLESFLGCAPNAMTNDDEVAEDTDQITLAYLNDLAKGIPHDEYEAIKARASALRDDPTYSTERLLILSGVLEALLVAQRAAENEACAQTCIDLWRNASNEPPDYKQNSIAHGCRASAEAIRARVKK